jgi:hypothetical protein
VISSEVSSKYATPSANRTASWVSSCSSAGVDDRAHVGPRRVDLRVDDCLQVEGRGGVVDLDHVVGPDFVQREPLALDVDGLASGRPRADVAEREIREALQGEDATSPRDLLTHRLGGRGDGHRRSVGG